MTQSFTKENKMQSKYEVVITNKETNKYVAFECSTPHEAQWGIDLAIKKLNNKGGDNE